MGMGQSQAITRDHREYPQMLLVKIGEYVCACVYRRSDSLWSLVIVSFVSCGHLQTEPSIALDVAENSSIRVSLSFLERIFVPVIHVETGPDGLISCLRPGRLQNAVLL